MALKLFWRCEGDTLSGTDDYTAGDSAATLNLATISSAQYFAGANSLQLAGSAYNAQFAVSGTDLVNVDEGALALPFRLGAFVSGNQLLRIYNSANSNHQIQVGLLGTDDATGRELRLRYRESGGNNVTLDTTTGCAPNNSADLALNTWYSVVARWHRTNNDLRIEVYDATGTLIAGIQNTAAGLGTPSGIDTIEIGSTTAQNLATTYIDNVFIADAYNEALQDFLDIASYQDYGDTGSSLPIFSAAYSQL